ncbi:hypothetical protein AB4Y90_13465 [Chryseobacterium sp. 2TAF14]|uniref:hypothetical protein n=1 Tax=Chryseobacterium sp. 2TAF14 TaxID=3233007 RepID=UPI003F8E4DF9
MRARAQCVNLNGKKLKFTLWEDDETGEGHNAKNLLIETKEATVDSTGVATAEFMLTRALMQKAMQGETDPKHLEFYVTVEYFSHNKHATDNLNVDNPLHVSAVTPQTRPQQPASNSPSQPTSEPPSNNAQPRAENSPAAEKPVSEMEERGVAGQNADPNEKLHDYQEAKGTIEAEQPPTPQANEGKTVSIVEDSSVEELIDAYFAKKEYTKQTGEAAGTLEYKFGSNGNKTSTDAEKENIAKIILGKPAVKALANKKEYTTLEAIKQVLTKGVYNKDEIITIQTFKLGAEFKKIISAPLDTKLYLVAKTAGSGLNDKQATIIIKEKDGLIKGSADAVLPILEITEEQMDQANPTTGEVPGTEKSEFTSKIENGLVKIPVHLRPKSDDDLKEWREKLKKGKQDGEYTYTFSNVNGTAITAENKKSLSETIAKNAKEGKLGNPKIEDGKVAYAEDIEAVLQIKTYTRGETIKFPLYKKEKELLYLNVKAQGEKQHDKNFLKADGAYFVVGGNCFCNRNIEQTEFEDILKKLRESERMANTTELFFADNCNLDDKTVAGFVDQLNTTLDKYNINTCIRKIHFLAQIYHETDRLQTTKEYGGTKRYSPYVGRGIMQLTHDSGYARYKAYLGTDVVTDYEKVAEELELAVDSAGWFWKQGKELSPGTSWTVPRTKFSEFDGSTGKQYAKQEFTYELNGVSRRYGTIDLSLLADADYIDTISWLVNGGDNGRMERREYLRKIKEIFHYPEDCENAGTSNGENSNVNIHFSGQSAHADAVSEYTRGILREVGAATENTDIYITSTARTPNDQARIMYDNASRDLQEQRRTYRAPGQAVIDVFEQNQTLPRDQVIGLMEARINELGPSSVSRHCADPNVTNVFDVSISRLTNPNDFLTEIRGRTEVQTVLNENGAYHIEISQ